MKYLILDVLNTFQCIGEKCPYTCCRGWKINIDSAYANFYRDVKGKFGKKLKNSIIDKDGVSVFKMNNGSCPFLNKESLCDVYINLREKTFVYYLQSISSKKLELRRYYICWKRNFLSGGGKDFI